jgi:hypothetical protein
MARLVYRVASASGALGCGFPHGSPQTVMDGRVDALIYDAASTAAGPLHPGSVASYCSRDTVKNNLRRMVETGTRIEGPVILGNCGMPGTDGNLNGMLEIAKEIFEELHVRDAQVAVIRSDVAPAIVIDELRAGALCPVSAAAPVLDDAALLMSTIVAQMGIHPIVTALRHGAKYVFAGRVCDAALFAADMIRQGVPPGLAYHAGHLLKRRARACVPGERADRLVAEIYDDGSAVFTAPNEDRRCTTYSIAACSLVETHHPHLQFFPEGVLTTVKTEFFAVDSVTAGIRGSRFYRTRKPWPWSVKLEGVRQRGADYERTIHHLLRNERVVRDTLFPISYHHANGADWRGTDQAQADYFEVGDLADTQDLDVRTLCAIEDVPPRGRPYASHCLLDIASVVRGVSADTGWITFDLMFASMDAYEMALLSNVFCRRNLAATLDLKLRTIIGSYFVDSCRTIRIALDPPRGIAPSGLHERFGERNQSVIERLIVPIYADPHHPVIR